MKGKLIKIMANFINLDDAIKQNGGLIVKHELVINTNFTKTIHPLVIENGNKYNVYWLGIINHKVITFGSFVNEYGHETYEQGIISVKTLSESEEAFYKGLPLGTGKNTRVFYKECDLVDKTKMSQIIKMIKDIKVTSEVPDGYEVKKEVQVELSGYNTVDFKDVSLDVGKLEDKLFHSIRFEDNKWEILKGIEIITGDAYDEKYYTETNKYHEEETYKENEFSLYVTDEVYKIFERDERDYELNIDGLIIKVTNHNCRR